MGTTVPGLGGVSNGPFANGPSIGGSSTVNNSLVQNLRLVYRGQLVGGIWTGGYLSKGMLRLGEEILTRQPNTQTLQSLLEQYDQGEQVVFVAVVNDPL
ncbi:MAG: hypothetical protein IPO56_11520 [Flavobacteriales bacterium]|nr:hypothetical protein [Flavobacteriales bacterium]